MEGPIRTLLVSGSVREPSYTRTLTRVVERKLTKRGAVTTHWNLREMPLPIADPIFHHNPGEHTDKLVREFVAHATACDAFVLSSPIYHNSYSGVLKNALDHLAIAQCCYKPFGLVSHGGNRSSQAVDHLRIVVRGLLGIAIPTQVCTDESDYCGVSCGGYELASEEILLRIERLASELIVFANALRLVRDNTRRA